MLFIGILVFIWLFRCVDMMSQIIKVAYKHDKTMKKVKTFQKEAVYYCEQNDFNLQAAVKDFAGDFKFEQENYFKQKAKK